MAPDVLGIGECGRFHLFCISQVSTVLVFMVSNGIASRCNVNIALGRYFKRSDEKNRQHDNQILLHINNNLVFTNNSVFIYL